MIHSVHLCASCSILVIPPPTLLTSTVSGNLEQADQDKAPWFVLQTYLWRTPLKMGKHLQEAYFLPCSNSPERFPHNQRC